MYRNALWRRVWDSRQPTVGLILLFDHLPPVLPTKTPGPPPQDASHRSFSFSCLSGDALHRSFIFR